jgi:hypothetical protein
MGTAPLRAWGLTGRLEGSANCKEAQRLAVAGAFRQLLAPRPHLVLVLEARHQRRRRLVVSTPNVRVNKRARRNLMNRNILLRPITDGGEVTEDYGHVGLKPTGGDNSVAIRSIFGELHRSQRRPSVM